LCSSWHARWIVRTIPQEIQYPYICLCLFVIFTLGLYLVPSVFLWRFAKFHMAQRRLLMKQVREFRVHSTQSFAGIEETLKLIKQWFGSVLAFEEYIHTEIPYLIESHQKMPMPFRMSLVGCLSHLPLFATYATLAFEDGEDRMGWNFVLTIGSVFVCSDSIALNLILWLTETSSAMRWQSSGGFFHQKIAGPVATACTFGVVNAIGASVVCPATPLWVNCLVVFFMCVALIWVYRDRIVFSMRKASTLFRFQPSHNLRETLLDVHRPLPAISSSTIETWSSWSSLNSGSS